MAIVRKRRKSLAECPIGLFMCGDELCLKTEYGSNEGRIDAYIVSTGEFFWGGASTIAEQRMVKVLPVDTALVIDICRRQALPVLGDE